MGQLITIDDSNYQQFTGDGETVVDTVTGRTFYNRAKVVRKFQSVSTVTMEQAGLAVFSESELKDRIAQIERDQAWVKDLMYDTPCPDQNGYGQCWAFGPCIAFWMRSWLQGGKPRMLSPNQAAYRAGYRNWGSGGGDPGDAVDVLVKIGGVREDIWPVGSSGHSTKWDTPQAKSDQEHNKATLIVEIPGGSKGWLAQASAVVQGIPLCCTWSWWNHVTSGCWLKVVGSEIQFGIRNSWGQDWSDNGYGLLAGSKKYSSNTFAFVEVTQSTQVPA